MKVLNVDNIMLKANMGRSFSVLMLFIWIMLLMAVIEVSHGDSPAWPTLSKPEMGEEMQFYSPHITSEF